MLLVIAPGKAIAWRFNVYKIIYPLAAPSNMVASYLLMLHLPSLQNLFDAFVRCCAFNGPHFMNLGPINSRDFIRYLPS